MESKKAEEVRNGREEGKEGREERERKKGL